MLSQELTREVREVTLRFWLREVEEEHFRAIFRGKEIGHRIADYVDEKTSELLEETFDTRREVDARGQVRARSMGDIWLGENGIYHPVNVKAGEVGKNGQPNLVSLTKLIDSWLSRQIDSYYLLIVKMARVDDPGTSAFIIEPHVYFVDMLDHLDFVTFDSGPGQAMLKEKAFYEAMLSAESAPSYGHNEKLRRLMDLMEDGDRRLIENRSKKMERLRQQLADYTAVPHHNLNQNGVLLGGNES